MNDKERYELLKKIINKADPIGLIDFETAESLNEYDPELKEILKKDISSMNREELSEWIYQVFIAYFNKDLVGKKEDYMRIADEFLSSLDQAK